MRPLRRTCADGLELRGEPRSRRPGLVRAGAETTSRSRRHPGGGAYLGVTVAAPTLDAASLPSIEATAALTPDQALDAVWSRRSGLTAAEVASRSELFGPNAVRSHHASAWSVLSRQLHSPLLWLLLAAAAVSGVRRRGARRRHHRGDRRGVGRPRLRQRVPGRARRGGDALARSATTSPSSRDGDADERRGHPPRAGRHRAPRRRFDRPGRCAAPGGERPRVRRVDPDRRIGAGGEVRRRRSPVALHSAELSSCLFMGTVVHEGVGRRRRGCHRLLDRSSGGSPSGSASTIPRPSSSSGSPASPGCSAKVGGVLSVTIFVINVALGPPRDRRGAVLPRCRRGHHPPAAARGRVRPAWPPARAGSPQKKVLVKRLVCIEDLGDIDVLFTDKTGTLTDGHISFERAMDPAGARQRRRVHARAGVQRGHVDRRTRAVGGNPLDVALWEAPGAATRPRSATFQRVAIAPFDHERRCVSVLVDEPRRQRLAHHQGRTRSGPRPLQRRPRRGRGACSTREFAAGNRVVAIATRPCTGPRPRVDAGRRARPAPRRLPRRSWTSPSRRPPASIARLADLGITVKIVTGDNPLVAETVCRDPRARLGAARSPGPTSTPSTTTQLTAAVNDAPRSSPGSAPSRRPASCAPSAAPARRSRSWATASTTPSPCTTPTSASRSTRPPTSPRTRPTSSCSNVTSTCSPTASPKAAASSPTPSSTCSWARRRTSGTCSASPSPPAFLPFLPMLPFQILLNNLLYDTSQMTIPTDHVDDEQLARPSHWDIGFIRRFMIRFGPISSLFDFATFAVMLWVFDAAAPLVPLRLVRRVARHPDPHRLRDPNPPGPVLPEPTVAPAARLGIRRRDRSAR